MPNIHLTENMQEYVKRQINCGAYANLSEVIRAAMRLLMKEDGAIQFYNLKIDLDDAIHEAENGKYIDFDPEKFEPEAF